MRFALIAPVLLAASFAAADETPTPTEQKAIDAIEKAGGMATIDPKLAPGARVAAKLTAATDATLLALRKHPSIGALDILDAAKCTTKGLIALKDLPKLRKLVLGSSNLTVAGARAIGQCADLRHLGLAEAGLTDAELGGLQNLKRLEHLTLSNNPKITDRGMQTVRGFERLQVLYLSNTALTDKGLAMLRVLDGLRTLNVVNTGVTAEAADKFVDEMPNLRAIRR
jgi:Leucine-rich repeat (LRR) protein